MSKDIRAEMEKIIVFTARREMVSDINSNQYFAIVAHESADNSKKEQFSVSFRILSSTYEIRNKFIGILPCIDWLSADALFKYITNVFI